MKAPKSLVVISMVTAFGTFFVSSAFGSGGHGGGNSYGGHSESAKSDKQKDNLSVIQAWVALNTNLANAEQQIAKKNLKSLHDITSAMNGAVSIMKENMDIVATSKRMRLQPLLKQLSTLIGKLHAAADYENTFNPKIELGKIKRLLKNIEEHYPSGMLPSKPN